MLTNRELQEIASAFLQKYEQLQKLKGLRVARMISYNRRKFVEYFEDLEAGVSKSDDIKAYSEDGKILNLKIERKEITVDEFKVLEAELNAKHKDAIEELKSIDAERKNILDEKAGMMYKTVKQSDLKDIDNLEVEVVDALYPFVEWEDDSA